MMQILTPSGYRDIAACHVGDEVSAFENASGAAIVNTIDTLQWVDAETFRDWQNPTFLINGQEHLGLHSLLVLRVPKNAPQPVKVRDLAVGDQVFRVERGDYVLNFEIADIVQLDPYLPFKFFRINGAWTLNSEQSIWRNGGNVCHAKHLIVGDVIYDDADRDVTITSIEEVAADGWWRFDISGDHSYIVDGLTLHNASRFWVGGTGSWTPVNTTPWAAATGGAGGQTVPGSADIVTLDGNSGGGTVTLNFGGIITLQSIGIGSFTGTFDNSVNNNNMTLTAASGFSGSGAGLRTIKLGTAVYTISASNGTWTFNNTANLTYIGNTGCSIVYTGSTGSRAFNGGGLPHGAVTFGASSGAGFYTVAGSNTLASLVITAPNLVVLTSLTTNTISGAFDWAGSSISQIGFITTAQGSAATIAAAAGSSAQYCAFRDMTFTGSPAVSNSFDLGNNSIPITAPGGSSGASRARAYAGL